MRATREPGRSTRRAEREAWGSTRPGERPLLRSSAGSLALEEVAAALQGLAARRRGSDKDELDLDQGWTVGLELGATSMGA